MAQFAVRVYRGGSGFRAVVDGWGSVEGRTLAETTEMARRLLLGVLGAAYPERPAAEPLGACLVVWFDVELRETRRRTRELASSEAMRSERSIGSGARR